MKTILKLIVLSLVISFSACENEGILSESESDTPQLRGTDDIKGCETAFAYHKDATCFLDEPNLNANRWGWSIGPIQSPFEMSYPIYQAAGQCDLDSGQLIGTLYVSYDDNDVVTVNFEANDGYGFFATHLYVGNSKYPRDRRGRFTVAPGQYPYQHNFSDGASADSYIIDDVKGDIYIIAHSEVCPFKKIGG